MVIHENEARSCCVRNPIKSNALSATPTDCVSMVPFTARDYSSLVSAASTVAASDLITSTSIEGAVGHPTLALGLIKTTMIVFVVFVL